MDICIVAHNAYGALTGEETGHIGGVERQTALLASWLVKRGHCVSVITWHEGDEDIEYVDGVKIIKLCRARDGLPGLRFFTPRWTSLNRALKQADAALYYHNCAEYVTGLIGLWCVFHHRCFVYASASDIDYDPHFLRVDSKFSYYLYRVGLMNAALLIAQTRKQKLGLQAAYGLDAKVLKMSATPPRYGTNYIRNALFLKQNVIWVGRLHGIKRPEWLIEIAQAMPDVHFQVMGPAKDDSDYTVSIINALKSTDNIEYLGKVNRHDMPKIYQNASILCCTSLYEGFPNTYLEAWSYGIPVVTSIDPDDVIKGNQLGFHVTEIPDFMLKISTLLNSALEWEVCSANSFHYYLQHHQQDKVMQTFEETLLNQLAHWAKPHVPID